MNFDLLIFVFDCVKSKLSERVNAASLLSFLESPHERYQICSIKKHNDKSLKKITSRMQDKDLVVKNGFHHTTSNCNVDLRLKIQLCNQYSNELSNSCDRPSSNFVTCRASQQDHTLAHAHTVSFRLAARIKFGKSLVLFFSLFSQQTW